MNPDGRCIQIAGPQCGLITRGQALGAGMTQEQIERRLARGHWIRLYENVYIIGAAPDTWQRSLWAAHLWVGDDGYFTGRTGALINRLDGVFSPAVEMAMTERSRPPDSSFFFRYTTRPPTRLETIDGLPVAPVERVLLDMAATDRPWRVELALDDALRKKRTTIDELHFFTRTEGRGLWGCRTLKLMLADRPIDDVILASKLEDKFVRLLEDSSLPPVVRHYPVMRRNGIPTEIDFAYPHVKLGPETDGYRWHTGRLRWQHDIERQNALAEIGWLILRFSWRDVLHRPGYVIETIRATISAREPLFR